MIGDMRKQLEDLRVGTGKFNPQWNAPASEMRNFTEGRLENRLFKVHSWKCSKILAILNVQLWAMATIFNF